MNKRVVSGILLILVLASLLANMGFVSADDEFNFPSSEIGKGLEETGKEFGGTLGPILVFLFNIQEKTHPGDIAQTLISFILAFIIVFVFVLIAFKNLPFFDENRGLSYFIVIVATLLGIRGIAQISPHIMNDIFMPYSALALTIINGTAVVAWFMLVNIGMKKSDFNFIRRFLWILFAVTFIGIWGMRTFFSPDGAEKVTTLTQWIYGVTIILSFIMAFIDGSIQGFFAKIEADKLNHENKVKRRAELKTQLKSYEDMVNDGTLDKDDFDILKKRIQTNAKVLGLKGHL